MNDIEGMEILFMKIFHVRYQFGGNPKNVFFLDPNLSALNEHGELLDRWGSPFVFHSLKADLMDIRSPGPDRELWTKDDLSLDHENTEAELRLKP